jgi:tetratricopeptide (TPR) repeat protein
MKASSIYPHRGFYEDGLAYCEAALSQLERKCPEDMHNRWIIYFRLYSCYIVLGKPLQALQVMEAAMTEIDAPEYLFHCCYMKAMLYARYLPDRELDKAEAYLEQGLEELARVDIPKHAKLFHTAFNRNGLALIRHRQGRSQEAVELCLSYYEKLNTHLKPDEQRLHRSVLLYNTAQVYAAVGSYEEAIVYFTAVMEMDPNYSEYYNERGNVYVKMSRFEDALNDYLMAIDLSPPYPEVWANLGRCYRMMGQMAKAVDAYSTSLDLDPNQFSVLVARAEAYEILNQPDAALADYNSALVLDASQPPVLANRAILHYDAGRYQEALDDLDLALALSPGTLELYQNRAIALIALGRFEDAAHNLRTYLKLNPAAEDRLEVENMLSTL